MSERMSDDEFVKFHVFEDDVLFGEVIKEAKRARGAEKRITKQIMEDIHYQSAKKLQKENAELKKRLHNLDCGYQILEMHNVQLKDKIQWMEEQENKMKQDEFNEKVEEFERKFKIYQGSFNVIPGCIEGGFFHSACELMKNAEALFTDGLFEELNYLADESDKIDPPESEMDIVKDSDGFKVGE